MKKLMFFGPIIIFLILMTSTLLTNGQQTKSVTYTGQLRVGKQESTIIYLGQETGDLVAFCFTNKSSVGRAILLKCKDKKQCQFSGTVNWETNCSIKGSFSASGKIVVVKAVKRINKK